MVYLRLIALLALGLFTWPSTASAQSCNGQFTAGQVCGNPGSTLAPPRATTLTSLLDQNFGAQQGMVLYRGPSAWIETATPTLGVPGSLQGSLAFAGATAGAITLQGPASTANYTFTLPPNSGTNGYVLTTNGAGVTSWANPSSGGTVTSVGLSAPPEFTVTISPITISGTLTFVKASQSENLCYCSPNGSSGVPTFRALVGSDLPNPTLSSLGGVQAVNAVSHEWINAINTSGVPQLSQPAFTDISGTIGPTQIPAPTATTLGGVFSLVQTTSNWINSITTAGQPVASQPSFSDIAGTIAASQLPVVGNNTILSNISGISGPATGNQLSPIFDSALGNTQGDIFYRSSSAWIALAPGTMGQVLTTGGSAADISWSTVSGTGTVTSVATNNGLTGGPITSSGTIGLASIATGKVLAFVGSVSGTPVATSPTAILDVIGSTQGDILYRGASSWAVLAPGSNGQFLQTTGAGGSPQWATSPAATSVTASNASGATTISSGNPGYALTQGPSGNYLANSQLFSAAGGWINKFRNPGMDIAQRGASVTASTTCCSYTIDGWIVLPATASATVNQSAAAGSISANTLNMMRVVGGSSTVDVKISQRIEAIVAAQLAGQTVTVQYTIVHTIGSTITPKLTGCYPTTTANTFPTGLCGTSGLTTDTNLSAVSTQSCATATQCTLAVTFVMAATTTGYEIDLDCNCTLAANFFQMTAADLRATPNITTGLNSYPPPPELRPTGPELVFNQRYYWQNNGASFVAFGSGMAPNTTTGYIHVPYPVAMISPPNITQSGTALFGASGSPHAFSSFGTSYIGLQSAFVTVVVASGLSAGQGTIWTSDASNAYVAADSEL